MTKKIAVGCCLIATFLAGCVEKPNPIGENLIAPSTIFTLADTTITAVRDTTFLTSQVNGTGTSDLIGRLSTNEEAYTLISFIPTETIDSLVGAVLDSVELQFSINYTLRVSQPISTFDIYEVTSPWSEQTLTADSVVSFGDTPIGTMSDSMTYGNIITATVDTTAVRRWINAINDTAAPRFYGFAIRPRPGRPGDNPGIVGLSSFGNASGTTPTMIVRYLRNNVYDSLIFTYGSDTYIAHYNTVPTALPFSVRAGFTTRSKIEFDPSFFTNHETINQARLTLFVDSTNTIKGDFSPDTIIAFFGLENDTISNYYSSSYYTYGLYGKDSVTGLSTYTFTNAGPLFQLWINNRYSNQGLILQRILERSSADQVAFYRSNDPDPAKRPTVKITYSTQ